MNNFLRITQYHFLKGYCIEKFTMSNARINTLNGKPIISTNAKTFGQTLVDRQTDPNIIQSTFVPPTVDGSAVTLQQFEYLLGISFKTEDTGTTPAVASAATTLYLVPDLTLTVNKHYQLTATISVILRPTTDSSYKCGIWTLTAAARDTALLGVEGYVLTPISVDDGMATYVPDNAITLSITSNMFKVLVTPVANITYSADLLVNAKIIASSYSNAL